MKQLFLTGAHGKTHRIKRPWFDSLVAKQIATGDDALLGFGEGTDNKYHTPQMGIHSQQK